MKAALSTLTARDDAGAPVLVGPGLHGGEGRHDEEAAGDRRGRARSIVTRRPRPVPKNVADAERRRRPAARPQVVQARSSANSAQQDRADQRRQQHDAAAGEPRGEARADRDADREHGEQQRDHDVLGAAEHVFTSGGSSDSTTAPTSQNQLIDQRAAPQPACRPSRSRSSAPVERAMLRVDRAGRARPRRSRGMSRLETQHSDARSTMISAPNRPGRRRPSRGEAADDGAEQDREEGRALDQRVAGGQFVAVAGGRAGCRT